ncbi:MAG TPA: hypothetical protein PK788_05830 [Gemmatimonadaceae bacterium]|nr:hypothetical protein [Gemmatimonadaceae bacterium]
MTVRLATLALPIALLAACGGGDSTADATATSTTTAERTIALVDADLVAAESGDLTTGVLLTGMLEPATSVTVTAQVPGTVTELLVDRGSVVAARDVAG